MRFGNFDHPVQMLWANCPHHPVTNHSPWGNNDVRNTLRPVHESSERCIGDPEARIGEHLHPQSHRATAITSSLPSGGSSSPRAEGGPAL